MGSTLICLALLLTAFAQGTTQSRKPRFAGFPASCLGVAGCFGVDSRLGLQLGMVLAHSQAPELVKAFDFCPF
jgi:hypothetical protein